MFVPLHAKRSSNDGHVSPLNTYFTSISFVMVNTRGKTGTQNKYSSSYTSCGYQAGFQGK